jgi:hypothetical protein
MNIGNQSYGSNAGWLVLQPFPSNQSMGICRIDSFLFDFSSSPNKRKDGRLPGMGSKLVQFAIEKSIQAGYEGRVSLISTNNSGPFYLKMGFRCTSITAQNRLEEACKDPNITFLDGEEMYLPEEAIATWKQKIAANPICLTIQDSSNYPPHLTQKRIPNDICLLAGAQG